MYLVSSLLAYRAFAATFEAIEVSFFCREHVLQVPGLCQLERNAPNKQEFVAKENLNFDGDKPREIIRHDDKTTKASNVTSPSEGAAEEEPITSTRLGALTFNPSPPLKEDEEFQLAAADDQEELMRWHYHLGHLSFAKLKLLANNGEIPCCLAKVPAPKCAGCLFGAMTKLPWHSKESNLSQNLRHNKAGGVRQRQSHDINACVIFRPIKRQTHLQAVPRRIHLRQPLLSPAVCAFDARFIIRQKDKSKRFI
jgi:hypothetical protein